MGDGDGVIRGVSSEHLSSIANGSSNGVFNYANVVLKSSLNKKEGLHLCLLNINSIRNKVDQLELLLENVKMDVICVTESKLNHDIPDKMILIKGFRVFRNDRLRDKGGGICIFIKKNISVKVIDSVNSPKFELSFLELNIKHRKILLCTVYRPPKSSCIRQLYSVLHKYMVSYKEIILCGDTNYDILKQNSKVTEYKNMLNNLSMTIMNTSEPTHFPVRHNPSLLDHVVTNTNNIKFLNQLSLGFSDHDFIYFTYNIDISPNIQSITFRDFKNLNLPNMYDYCSSLPWHSMYASSNIDEQLSIFNNLILQTYNRFIPLKSCKINTNRPPWLNSRILREIEFRDIAYKKWKKSKTLLTRIEYKRLRNHVTFLIKKAKFEFLNNYLDPRQPSSQFWKKVKSVGIGKTKQDHSSLFSPQQFNNYFCNNEESQTSNLLDTQPLGLNQNERSHETNYTQFSFHCVTLYELHKALLSIKSNATGLDNIPLKLIKILFPAIQNHILYLFNNVITYSTFPECWKQAKILALNKTPKPKSLSDFRPISILSVLSKVLEKILQCQISVYVEKNNFLSEYQSAYRKFHSTSTAILNIADDIYKELDQRKAAILCLLDFSKAFDTIDHKLLLHKLKQRYNFHTTACTLVESYLINRSQIVVTDCGSSTSQISLSGVPQGSVLGPIFFALFINDVTASIKNCKYHLYADDLQIYNSGKYENILVLTQEINNDISNIILWSRKNGLHLNAKKTQAIFLSTCSREIPEHARIKVDNVEVSFSPFVKDLGVYIDERLSWSHHVEYTCKKINNILRQLWVTTSFADINLRKRFFNSYVLPHFLFGSNVIYGMAKESFAKLQLVFNSCTRYVYGLRKYDHISDFKQDLLGCNLNEFLDIQVILNIFNVLKSGEPTYLAKKLLPLRSSRLNNLSVRKNRIKHYNKSFFVRGIGLWNSLPLHFKSSSSSSVLRKKLLSLYSNPDPGIRH